MRFLNLFMYLDTVKHLKPAQVWFWGLRKLRNPVYALPQVAVAPAVVTGIPFFLPALDLDPAYLARFDVDGLLEGQLTLLHETHPLDFSLDTKVAGVSPLWQFNLHYLEYLIPLVQRYKDTGEARWLDAFHDIHDKWMENDHPSRLHPYVVTKRLQFLLVTLDLLKEDLNLHQKEEHLLSIYRQYLLLGRNTERHLLGNHYLENLITLAIVSLLFNDHKGYRKYSRRLFGQLRKQFLADGMHQELSLMYHKILLEGLLRLAYAYQYLGHKDLTPLMKALQPMLNVAASLELGMGRTPLFNDAGDNVAKGIGQLMAAAAPLGIVPVTGDAFAASGYYKLYDGNLSLMADVGRIAADHIPGHGQCDCLSFELSVAGVPLLVNSGTFAYQGPLRAHFRSTAAHNTVLINGQEQSQCWREHRVARRISRFSGSLNGQNFQGSYRNYRGDRHQRSITLSDGQLKVTDTVKALVGDARAESWLRFAPPWQVTLENDELVITKDGKPAFHLVAWQADIKLVTQGVLSYYAPTFGNILQASAVRLTAKDSTFGFVLTQHTPYPDKKADDETVNHLLVKNLQGDDYMAPLLQPQTLQANQLEQPVAKVAKKVLVLVSYYPNSKGGIALMYVHVRCQAYARQGIAVEVLNLSAQQEDLVDGIRVITLDQYRLLPVDAYDTLVLHAANVRQHLRFLKRFGDRFRRHIFFFHGHEVLRINAVYAKDYPYLHKGRLKLWLQDLYDTYKLRVWHRYFVNNAEKTIFVFVSQWMKDEFLKWTKVPPSLLAGRSHIIYNAINQVFESGRWDAQSSKDYDFITIRGTWDGAKYAVDVVNQLARLNPGLRFLLVGKGHFFQHYEKADNLELLETHLAPRDMLSYLNLARAALMPTRTDAQGLMMCEMASFGMPLVTSDIPVCQEVLGDFANVALIENDNPPDNLAQVLQNLEANYQGQINRKFFAQHTVDEEVRLLEHD